MPVSGARIDESRPESDSILGSLRELKPILRNQLESRFQSVAHTFDHMLESSLVIFCPSTRPLLTVNASPRSALTSRQPGRHLWAIHGTATPTAPTEQGEVELKV